MNHKWNHELISPNENGFYGLSGTKKSIYQLCEYSGGYIYINVFGVV